MTESSTGTAPLTQPVPVPANPPPGYWQREGSHYPQPLTPMMRSAYLDPFNAIWRNLAVDHGMFIDGLELAEIGGWVYQRLRPLGGKDRKPPPPWLMWILVRTLPSMRGRVRACVRGIREESGSLYIEEWNRTWRQEQIDAVARFRAIDLTALGDRDLEGHLDDTIRFLSTSTDRHFRLVIPITTIVELAMACEELLGWDEPKTLDLMAGLSLTSTEPARQLARLSALARERPAVRALLENVDETTANRLPVVDHEFAAALEEYQREFGFRALRYEIVDPTLEEVPALTLHLIHDQLVRAFDPVAEASELQRKREAALARARAELASRPEADRQRFERLLARAERYYPVREENEFYTISQPIAVMRRVALEIGRRLAERGQIAARDDVFYLEVNEARESLTSRDDRRQLVERRKGERAWTLAHPGAPTYGTAPPPPPPLSVFPAEVAFVIKATNWATDRVFGGTSNQKQAPSTTLRGMAAAAGSYTGTVRVVMDESEFDKIQAGDVLVCPITSPVWSIIFPSVGALVTDTGGILSHPAIISREYGVPAVVGTGNATEILKDGQTVTVDGVAGTVTLV